LSATAFAAIAPLSAGLVNVSYQVIADPPLPGPLAVRVKEGSSPYWLALLVMNTGNPLTSVQLQTPSGGWTGLSRASYNYWIAQSGAGTGPFTVRLTDTLGHQVTVHDVALEPGVVQGTGAWMYGAGAVPSASATSPAPATTMAAPATTRAAPTTTAARRQGSHTQAHAHATATVAVQAQAVPTASRSAPRPSARPTC
jgi:expansin